MLTSKMIAMLICDPLKLSTAQRQNAARTFPKGRIKQVYIYKLSQDFLILLNSYVSLTVTKKCHKIKCTQWYKYALVQVN